MDTFTPSERSRIMRQVHSRNTQPELAVRSLVHRLGFRFTLHRRDLPGNPDLVFPARRRIIFVHGCFWHGHRCRAGRNRPASNTGYWIPKLDRNRRRDRINRRLLARLGWRTLVVWECELKRQPRLEARIVRFFEE